MNLIDFKPGKNTLILDGRQHETIGGRDFSLRYKVKASRSGLDENKQPVYRGRYEGQIYIGGTSGVSVGQLPSPTDVMDRLEALAEWHDSDGKSLIQCSEEIRRLYDHDHKKCHIKRNCKPQRDRARAAVRAIDQAMHDCSLPKVKRQQHIEDIRKEHKKILIKHAKALGQLVALKNHLGAKKFNKIVGDKND